MICAKLYAEIRNDVTILDLYFLLRRLFLSIRKNGRKVRGLAAGLRAGLLHGMEFSL